MKPQIERRTVSLVELRVDEGDATAAPVIRDPRWVGIRACWVGDAGDLADLAEETDKLLADAAALASLSR